MRVTKKSGKWDVSQLPKKLVAEFEAYEDMTSLKNKKGQPLTALKLTFRIDDDESDFDGNTIDKLLWYKENSDGGKDMGAKAFQTIEALEGGVEREDGDDSPPLESLYGNRVLLTIVESTRNEGYPDIFKVEPFDDDDDEEERPKKSKKKKGKKKTAKKPEPEPEMDDEDEDDDDEDDDTPPPPPKKKGKAKKGKKKTAKKPEPEPDDDDDDDDDDFDDFDDD